MVEPKIILTNTGKSSYSDGTLWVAIRPMDIPGNGVWLKSGERLAILPAAKPVERTDDRAKDLWSEHPAHRRKAWQDEACGSTTQLGYWDWVDSKLEQARNEPAGRPAET